MDGARRFGASWLTPVESDVDWRMAVSPCARHYVWGDALGGWVVSLGAAMVNAGEETTAKGYIWASWSDGTKWRSKVGRSGGGGWNTRKMRVHANAAGDGQMGPSMLGAVGHVTSQPHFDLE